MSRRMIRRDERRKRQMRHAVRAASRRPRHDWSEDVMDLLLALVIVGACWLLMYGATQ